jgi:hypothetical protein
MVTTPNMQLTEPVVQGSPDVWGDEINEDLNIIDSHSHVPDGYNGVAITTAAININDDLSVNSFDVRDARSVEFDNQEAPLAGSEDLQCIYVSDGDLWYNDDVGNQIRITDGGTVLIPTVSNYIIKTVNSNITIDPSDVSNYLVVNTASSRTIELPLAGDVVSGRFYVIKDVTGESNLQPITLLAQGLDTIDGQGSIDLTVPAGSWQVVGNGVDGWYLQTDANQAQMEGTYGVDTQSIEVKGINVQVNGSNGLSMSAGTNFSLNTGNNVTIIGGNLSRLIGGAEVEVRAPVASLESTTGNTTIDSAGAIIIGSIGDIQVSTAGSISINPNSNVLLSAGAVCSLSGTDGIELASTIISDVTIGADNTTDLTVNSNTTINGTLEVNDEATFNQPVTFELDTAFNNNNNQFNGDVTVSQARVALVQGTSARFIHKVTTAPNADTTYIVQNIEYLFIAPGTGAHTYTINDDFDGTSGDEGLTICIINRSSNNQGLQGDLFPIPKIITDAEWVEFVKIGSDWVISMVGQL